LRHEAAEIRTFLSRWSNLALAMERHLCRNPRA
jgi:hypothetical protein